MGGTVGWGRVAEGLGGDRYIVVMLLCGLCDCVVSVSVVVVVCAWDLMLCACSLSGNDIGTKGAAAFARALRDSPGALTKLFGVTLATADPDLPLELRSANNKTILKFYWDLAREAVTSRRCRMMLLGNGSVGKTTLAHRLVTGAPADRAVDVTHGVLQRASGSAAPCCNCLALRFFRPCDVHTAVLQTTGSSPTPMLLPFLPTGAWR